MPQPKARDVSYMVLENLKISLMSEKPTLTERNAMTLIADFLLMSGSSELLKIYNEHYCEDNHNAVAEALMA